MRAPLSRVADIQAGEDAETEPMECPTCQRQTSAYSKHCKHCGKPIPPGQYLLEEWGVIEPVLPVGRAAVEGEPGAGIHAGYRYARLGDRFLAFVLDTSFLFGPFAVVDAWVFMRWGSVDGAELQLTAASLVVVLMLNATLLFLYGWLLEGTWGITIGKAIVGIRVVGTARPRSFSACALRNLLRIVDGLGFYLVGTVVAACSTGRQRVGDIYARTAVIEDSVVRGVRIAAVALWFASLAAAGWAVPRICSVDHFVSPPYLSQVIIQVGKNERSAYLRVGGLALHVQLASTAR